MTPLVSIVTGTYNRLPYLKAMVSSVRLNMPDGIPYEIVVVDGGSTDSTQSWCREQPDIELIEQGELTGAIIAFTAGAESAQGDYVLLANDDIVFDFDSIIPAVVHLETTPDCGAVAFADDRRARGKPEGMGVQVMRAQNREQVIYAQVGLFRRWLGDVVGWWGARNENFESHTYGGDNYLSAGIWEKGYTVDTVAGAQVKDNVADDDLRRMNFEREGENPGGFYKLYPDGPHVEEMPLVPNQQGERLRVLYLPIYEPGHPQQRQHKRGLREAFGRVGIVYEIDFVNVRFDLVETVKQFRPHLLFLQCHAATSISQSELAKAREAQPDMVVVNWNGDVYEEHLTSESMLDFLRHIDLQLVVNANVLTTYQERGIAAAYWQVAPEPVDYDNLPAAQEHDVVFLANAYSEERQKLGRLLRNIPGVNVGLYGRGWDYSNGDTTYDFPAGAAIYRKAKIAIGDNQYLDQYGFVSNRIFEVLASGVLLLHQRIDGLEDLTGLQDEVHYIRWEDGDDLQKKIKQWLDGRRNKRRQQIAGTGREFVQHAHSFDARVKQLLLELIPLIEKGQHDPI